MMSDRLFFALWPGPALRDGLAARLPGWTRGITGRVQRPDQWHVTLEFLGDVSAERQIAVQAAAASVRATSFEVQFDAIEHWRRPQVLCLVARQVPEPLVQLVADLRAALAAAGFAPEARAYRPHVTLARKVSAAAPSVHVNPPFAWSSDRYALVRSTSGPAGSRYEPVGWWNLAA